MIVKKIGKKEIEEIENNQELQKLLQGINFGKLYAYAIEKVTPTEQNELENTEGEWVKYNKDSDHMPLVESLQGYGTGWCTSGETTAQLQLKGGDFYVYYSNDKNNNPTIPRVAIRMQGNNIAEVRGIAPEQNLDPYINDVVDEKLEIFSNGEEYKKKVADMKQLTKIEKKNLNEEELSKEDLRFLYEVDSNIEGFGYQKDPRIEELLEGRDIQEDLSYVFDCSKEQIALTEEEALSGGMKCYPCDLALSSLQSIKGLNLPETIIGSLNLNSLQSIKGLNLPETIIGSLNLNSLQSAEGLNLPKTINGSLYLNSLQSAEGLNFPETINGSLNLRSLQSIKGLNLPKTINGSLALSGLQSAEKEKLKEKYPQYCIL